MKNIKDITISIFAIIGFVFILSSFNNQTQETHSAVPESHVWELTVSEQNAFSINKVTGEVKLYARGLTGGSVTTGLKEYKAMPTPYGERNPK